MFVSIAPSKHLIGKTSYQLFICFFVVSLPHELCCYQIAGIHPHEAVFLLLPFFCLLHDVCSAGPQSEDDIARSVVTYSSSSETLEELVDQMEIEINDHNGDADDTSVESKEDLEKPKGVVFGVEGGAITIRKVRAAGGGAGEVVSEKIELPRRY